MDSQSYKGMADDSDEHNMKIGNLFVIILFSDYKNYFQFHSYMEVII
ncbi:hypothetical protein [Anaerocolumna sp. MB42-C2]|nr:hypothetical protein [Anaerocolumna sp. MB42-C2]WMJ87809.1 hypothetical protein RBU59_27900 [Anaerocolumna sp. MB42-C2]